MAYTSSMLLVILAVVLPRNFLVETPEIIADPCDLESHFQQGYDSHAGWFGTWNNEDDFDGGWSHWPECRHCTSSRSPVVQTRKRYRDIPDLENGHGCSGVRKGASEVFYRMTSRIRSWLIHQKWTGELYANIAVSIIALEICAIGISIKYCAQRRKKWRKQNSRKPDLAQGEITAIAEWSDKADQKVRDGRSEKVRDDELEGRREPPKMDSSKERNLDNDSSIYHIPLIKQSPQTDSFVLETQAITETVLWRFTYDD